MIKTNPRVYFDLTKSEYIVNKSYNVYNYLLLNRCQYY